MPWTNWSNAAKMAKMPSPTRPQADQWPHLLQKTAANITT